MAETVALPTMLTIAFATGTEPGKWFRRYKELTGDELAVVPADDPFALLGSEAVLALTRLPDARVTDDFHVVRLYEEAPGVAVPKDSVFAEVGTVSRADLVEEIVNLDFEAQPRIDDLRSALQVVAANVGVVYAPLPLLKNLSKKQVTALPLPAGEGPVTPVALVWRKTDDCNAVQDFVGVAKGRTARSSRGAAHPRSGGKRARR